MFEKVLDLCFFHSKEQNEKKKSILKFQIEEVPCCSSSWDFVLSFDWVQVQSGKWIAYKPRGAAKKERNREREREKEKERKKEISQICFT